MTNPQHERVTMRTLAERLGVTKTTVSLALRDHHSISKGTRERVLQLAREMNYRPDPAVSAIAAQRWSGGTPERHRVIAFLGDKNPEANGIQSDYFTGARERAEELGYKLEPFPLEKYPNSKSLDRVLDARGIRGLLVPPLLYQQGTARAMGLEWNKYTAVCCGVGRVRPPLHTVTSDYFITTRLVWEVVARAGYRRIGCALYCHDPIADDDWLRMGASSAAMHLLKLKEAEKIPILTAHVLDEKSLMAWYNQYKPEIIVSFNQATGELLERNGVAIPGEVELVSLYCPLGSRWSGIGHHYEQVARTSIDVLNAELRDNHWGLPPVPNITLIKPEWNMGSSFRHDEMGASYTFETTKALVNPLVAV